MSLINGLDFNVTLHIVIHNESGEMGDPHNCCFVLLICLFFSGADMILARYLKTAAKSFIRYESIEFNVFNVICVE